MGVVVLDIGGGVWGKGYEYGSGYCHDVLGM